MSSFKIHNLEENQMYAKVQLISSIRSRVMTGTKFVFIHTYILTYVHTYIHTSCVELLASHQAHPQAVDRGKLVRYDEYRGNQIPGADHN